MRPSPTRQAICYPKSVRKGEPSEELAFGGSPGIPDQRVVYPNNRPPELHIVGIGERVETIGNEFQEIESIVPGVRVMS
jgi:hypothetical protein